MTKVFGGIKCDGSESRLSECYHGEMGAQVVCPEAQMVAGVVCTPGNHIDLLLLVNFVFAVIIYCSITLPTFAHVTTPLFTENCAANLAAKYTMYKNELIIQMQIQISLLCSCKVYTMSHFSNKFNNNGQLPTMQR